MKDIIEQTINGNKYSAERIVSGKVKLRQTIIFMGHKEEDSMTYSSDDGDQMKITASLILWQLVTEGWPGTFPLEQIK